MPNRVQFINADSESSNIEAVNHSGHIFGVVLFTDGHKMSDVLQNS